MPHGRVMRRLRARAVPDRRIHRFNHLRVPEAGFRRRAAATPPTRITSLAIVWLSDGSSYRDVTASHEFRRLTRFRSVPSGSR
jgi:hypothetical protein